MSFPNATVDVEWLAKHQKNVKILDMSFTMKPKPDHKEFMAAKYGKFKELTESTENAEFINGHVPGAVHFDLDIASYPGEFARFDLYSPSQFSEYLRLLGVNSDDHLVLVGRGPAAGMLFAARAWWLLKVYGHKQVSVLVGGFEAWKLAGNAVETGNHKSQIVGNFLSTSIDSSFYISFEELTEKDAEGESILDNCEKLNFFDARASEQFNGVAPLGIPAKHATGSHVRGSRNLPLVQIMTENGPKSGEDIKKVLKMAHFNAYAPTITSCITGVQAALLSLVLYENGVKSRLFNGSMMELAFRASHLINGNPEKDEYN